MSKLTKKDLVRKLVDGLNYTEKSEKELEGMTKAELEKLVAAEEEKQSKKSPKDGGEGKQENKDDKHKGKEESVEGLFDRADEKDTEIKDELEEGDAVILRRYTTQLRIYREFMYTRRHKDSKILVVNLGPGDVYAGDQYGVKHGDKKALLRKGQDKLFEDTPAVRLIASSQPEVEILEIK